MRYAVICLLASLVVWPQRVAAEIGEEAPTKSSLTIHAQHHLPPQLMLRASYYYLLDDSRLERWHPEAFKDPSSPAGEPALKLEGDSAGVEVTPTEGTSQPTKGLSKGGRIAVGVIVPLVVIGAIAGAMVMATGFDDL